MLVALLRSPDHANYRILDFAPASWMLSRRHDSDALARLMTEFGWTAVRVRDPNGHGYTEQTRGYVRQLPANKVKCVLRSWD
jgi:hypothetical protein